MTWIERVRAADAEAETFWMLAANTENEMDSEDPVYMGSEHSAYLTAVALLAIAAELRAQRIARRPGAGK